MAAKTPKFKAVPASQLTVGYSRLPSKTSSGSRADFNKMYTKEARSSMEGIVTRFRALITSLKNATPAALEEALSPTFDKAKLYCPKKTGALVRSAEMVTRVGDNGTASVQISFGQNGVIHYAAIVHERTDLHHVPPTRSKFLQAAVEEDLNKMKRRFSAALKRLAGMNA